MFYVDFLLSTMTTRPNFNFESLDFLITWKSDIPDEFRISEFDPEIKFIKYFDKTIVYLTSTTYMADIKNDLLTKCEHLC